MKKVKKNILIILMLFSISAYCQNIKVIEEVEGFLKKYGDHPVLDITPEQTKKLKLIVNDSTNLGKWTRSKIRSLEQDMDYIKKAIVILEDDMRELSKWRKLVHQTEYVRRSFPLELNRLEEEYDTIRLRPVEMNLRNTEDKVGQLSLSYKKLLERSSQLMKRNALNRLNSMARQLDNDIKVMDSNDTDTVVLYRKGSIDRRLGNRTIDGISDLGNVFDDPPYFPPPPPPIGPKAPIVVDIVERGVDNLELLWIDLSTNETGNRLMRMQEGGFEEIENFGTFTKFSSVNHVDTGLTPNTQYCYKIETFNDEGFNSSQFRCAYTRDTISVPVWRVRLKVVVADVKHAGTDNLMRARLKTADGGIPVYTYIDYAQNDFKRNTTHYYDLNFDGIEEMADIIGFSLDNTESGDNLLIKNISLLVNEFEVFNRFFGDTSSSALKVSVYNSYNVEYDELTNHPSWQNYRGAVNLLPAFVVFPLTAEIDGEDGLIIENEELVSRIEALIGHLIHSDPELQGKMKWGKLNGEGVEIIKKSDKAVSVDLDLQAKVNNQFDPALDIDFDITFSKSCLENGSVLNLAFTSSNFVTDTDSSWWQDILSLGTSYITSELLDWYSDNCTTPPSISRSIDIRLDDTINCEELEISINDDGDLVICCISN